MLAGPRSRAAAAALLLLLPTAGCWQEAVGIPPDPGSFNFPSGMALDPRPVGDPEAPGAPRYLFVANANSDLALNASSVVAVDLQAFFSAWEAAPGSRQVRGDIPDVGAELDEGRPCRRKATRPQVVECREESFIVEDATVYMSSFATVIKAVDRDPGDGRARLFSPVRGDPSITYFDIVGGLGDGGVRIECEQGEDPDDPRRCGDARRLRFLFDDPEGGRLAPGPANVAIADSAAVAVHFRAPNISLVDLDGGGGDRPQLVDAQPILADANSFGGYGVAIRPCDPDNAASVTFEAAPTCIAAPGACAVDDDCGDPALGCEGGVCAARGGLRCEGPDSCAAGSVCAAIDQPCRRPLFYVAARDLPFVITLTTGSLDGGDEQRLVGNTVFGAGGFDIGDVAGGFAVYGEIAFDRSGERLYVAQTNPGGLVRVDTSLDAQGRPRNLPAGTVEVCDAPNALILYEDEGGEYAVVSCHRPALLFVVELASFRVVASVIAGTAPHAMLHDPARELIYVANSLDQTISVIDVARHHPTRFTEVARLGLEDPYSQ